MAKLVPPLLDWFSQNARDLPWRRTRDPYAIWISEIMLQQTQVKTVRPYWERWMRELPILEAAASAGPDKIHKLWEGLGYYTRARNLQKAARQIMERHGGKFPRNFEDVLALPGVGRYTAGAICSIAFNQATPVLDGNVMRVLTRIFGIEDDPRERKTGQWLWQIAGDLIAQAKAAETAKRKTCGRSGRGTNSCSCLNQSLMELGAVVCTPRNPECQICPVQRLCVAFLQNRADKLPALRRRVTATPRRFAALVVERNGKFLVRRRPAGVVNAHLWEFPNAEIGAGLRGPRHTSAIAEAATEILGLAPAEIKPLCQIKHSITRYRITMEAFRVRLNGFPSTPPGVWMSAEEFDSLAFAAAHKKLALFAAGCMLSG
ncbi:MAG: A/G-specific adenine glycosylase [Verrucomicrobiota bacterium]|nr:A/G-specific adenine glycosylase [Verrucomicrobiota bacterium]